MNPATVTGTAAFAVALGLAVFPAASPAVTTIDAADKYSYGANIGWIHFEDLGAAKLDLVTGEFSGRCYSANCGWISLSNPFLPEYPNRR